MVMEVTVEAKWCAYGNHWRLLTDFHKSKASTDGHQGTCKACSLDRKREEYVAHPRRFRAHEKRRRVVLGQWVRDLKEASPCTDCGQFYPSYVMDFDHLPEFTKTFQIAWAILQRFSREKIEAEIAKCELVCANCHRIRTNARSESLAEAGVSSR